MTREVRKRDNRIVPFDQSKIADAIYRALRSVGEGDRALAEELAAAVTHFLEERFDQRIPTIEDIQDLVETVLMEMGHPRVAKAYILYRQKRSMLRETLEVRKDVPHGEGVSFDYAASEGRPPRREETPVLPRVEESHSSYGTGAWSKSKITAALIREADVDPSVAEEIASSVERKVIDSGVRRISTSLIRELVDNELFERGFSAKLEKQQPIGLPKYNLEQIIFGTDSKEGYTFPKTPSEVRELIANRILQQYSLQEVYSPEVADAHREGRIFIHRLTDPIRCARVRWELPAPSGRRDDLAAASRTERAARRGASMPVVADSEESHGNYLDVGDFFRRLEHLGQFASEEMRLGSVFNLLLDPLSRDRRAGPRERDALVRQIVERLSQQSGHPEIALDLDLGGRSLPWIRAFLELPPRRARRLILSVRLDPRAFASSGTAASRAREATGLVAELYRRGDRIEFLPPRSAPAGGAEAGQGRISAGRGAPRRRMSPLRGERTSLVGERPQGSCPLFSGVLSKVTINLPRVAYRSGQDRRASVESELDLAIDLAVKGHLERRQFAARLAQNRENPLWELFGKQQGRAAPLELDGNVEFSIGILGLAECVKFLTGKELHQDRSARQFGLDLVRRASAKIARESRGLGVRLRLEETDNLGPLHALEASDRRLYPEITEVERGRQAGAAGSYTNGVRVHRSAPLDPLRRLEELTPFLSCVEAARGVVEELPELRSCDADLLLSLLEEGLPLLAASSVAAAHGPEDATP